MAVQFEDDAYARIAPQRIPGMYRFLGRLGIKNRSQANMVLFAFVIVCGVLIYSFWPSERATHPNAPYLTEEDNQRAGNPSEIGRVNR